MWSLSAWHSIHCVCVCEFVCCSMWSNVCKLLNVLQLCAGAKETAVEQQKCEFLNFLYVIFIWIWWYIIIFQLLGAFLYWVSVLLKLFTAELVKFYNPYVLDETFSLASLGLLLLTVLYLVFACLFSCTVFILSFCMFIFLYCFVCQYQSSDWLWRPPPKCPILCRVGR